ncbi:MAG: hypothetical protein A3D44_04090 [Candidatus Staskawiczbacteria bacterium RIFCSPHIGHO2_02_FULL_42_22]|uniref:Uncharacterized protein n=1 Tax=Candidatus Staskawiczbacteria bacterium RIFCSPHIGHO2_02_FULL_42_22 TaxID=1802207 RepID=A0A1G2I1J6_9BACT|nr:MAG: hypothetical protein A3D44_04090 [Candidatus Staskawiczbacteria bacterium RIFCSPHIGHO2_02_FULL_42_22]
MRISLGKNVKGSRAAQEGRASPFGGLFVDNIAAKLGKNVLGVGKLPRCGQICRNKFIHILT